METNECPQCGATATPSERRCNYCKAEFFVSSLAYLGSLDVSAGGKYLKHYKELTKKEPDNTEGFLGLGLCYLQMKTYPLATKCFEQIIEHSPDVSQAYYYFVLSKIAGRRLMTLSLTEVRQFETYLNTATLIDSEIPHYALLFAMLKRDYYERNGMKVSPPNSSDLLSKIRGLQVDRNEIEHLNSSVKVSNIEQYYNNLAIS